MYLNSDILTQAIVLRLKIRKNRLLDVLNSCLNMVDIPEHYPSKYMKHSSLTHKIDKLNFNVINRQDNDSLNLLLFGLMSLRPSIINNKVLLELVSINKNYKEEDKYSPILNPNFLQGIPKQSSTPNINNFFIKYCLKHKAIAGVRLEAKGRLTKRFTASRSLFKLKWKGSLKNEDSSHKGLSAVMLRGYAKSNVQYSLISSITRVGAYGVKSWVSSK